MPVNESCREFFAWFQRNGGTVDLTVMGIADFPLSEGGRGAVALMDIPEGHILFSIPRNLTLSTRTSSLPSVFGLEAWKNLELHTGWSGLILSMIWEAVQGSNSRWAEYLNILPDSFDTPMFWDEKDLAELLGTSIIEKLGKDQAERDFEAKVKPAIQSRPDLFPAEHSSYYTLHTYHVMGSRILSRSFGVEKWRSDEDDDHEANKSMGSSMDVDEQHPTGSNAQDDNDSADEDNDDEDEEDGHDSSDTAMVPMADMLNARYGTENAKLFHEKDELKMITTKSIKCGEQIWNTYGDLPNSELLRRYGHVDILPLPNGEDGNPGDVVEIRADAVVNAVREAHPDLTTETITERIDWWLEEGGDDTFEFDLELDYPEAVLSIVRLFLLSEPDFKKAQTKGKPPKPKADGEVLPLLQKVIQQRLKEYPTSIEKDEALSQTETLPVNLRNSVIVRLGEKRILNAILAKLVADLRQHASGNQNKRKSDRQEEAKSHKKSRR